MPLQEDIGVGLWELGPLDVGHSAIRIHEELTSLALIEIEDTCTTITTQGQFGPKVRYSGVQGKADLLTTDA